VDFASAIGNGAQSLNLRSTAIGFQTRAFGADSVAIGSGAQANHASATAIGTGALSSAANEVALGGTGSSVRIGDIAASTAAQQGPIDVVTVDANGTLGRQQAASAASVANVRVSINALSQITQSQFDTLASQVSGLDRRLAGVEFRLEEIDQRARGGIAAAAALGSAIAMPDRDFVIAGNFATYGGEQGYALNLVRRAGESVAFTAGVAGNTGEGDVIAQAGFAIGF
jgi:hypothetical protein